MADILKMFPFNEIKTNQTVGSSTSAVFFPKMYFCNKTLESGPYKGKFAYLVSKYGGSGYHLAPTFYNEGVEAKTGVYFAKYKSFSNGNTSGWLKGNIYDYHFLLRLYLISGRDYGGLIRCGEIHYSACKRISGGYMLIDNKRQGEYVASAKFDITRDIVDHKIGNRSYMVNGYPSSFKTGAGNGYNFGDLFLPGSYDKNKSKSITNQLSLGNPEMNDNKICLHFYNPPEDDVVRLGEPCTGGDTCSKQYIMYIKVV